MNTFGTNLRKAREARKLSQTKLAELTQLSQSAISSYENGTRIATGHLLSLAEALQVSPQWLMHGVNDVKQARFFTAEPSVAQQENSPFQFQWPFSNIHPVDYYKLNEQQRDLIERTVINLIQLANNR